MKPKYFIFTLIAFVIISCSKETDNPFDPNSNVDFSPDNLIVIEQSSQYITLGWYQKETRIDGFKIDRRIEGQANEIEYATVGKNNDSWSDLNVSSINSGKKITYDVYAYAGANLSVKKSIDAVSGEQIFTDNRDLQKYKWINLGDQKWMAENLNYKAAGFSSCYEEDESHCAVYGKLYDYNSAIVSCPEGWHLPTDEEWQELELYIGMPLSEVNLIGGRGDDEGYKLKSTTLWEDYLSWPGTGSDEFGFNALPAGYGASYDKSGYLVKNGNSEGWYDAIGKMAGFWTSTNTDEEVFSRLLDFNYSGIRRTKVSKQQWLSIRCIKN